MAIKWFERAHSGFRKGKTASRGYYYVGSSLQQARRYGKPRAVTKHSSLSIRIAISSKGAHRNVDDTLRYAGKFDDYQVVVSTNSASPWSAARYCRFVQRSEDVTEGYDAALLLTRVAALPVTAKT